MATRDPFQPAEETYVGPLPQGPAEGNATPVEQTPPPHEIKLPSRRYISLPSEQILIREGHLSEEKLSQARLIAEERGELLEDVLVAAKMVTAAELLEARSEQLDIPYCTKINTKHIDVPMLEKIPLGFAKARRILPLVEEDGCVTIACSDPYDLEAFDQLRVLLKAEPMPLLCDDQLLINAINQAYDHIYDKLGLDDVGDELEEVGQKDEFGDIDEAVDLLDMSDDEAPVIRLVNALIHRAIKERASDIHIEPFEKEVVVRFRVDGVLYEVTSVPKRAHSHIAARVKIMSQLDIAEKRLPQDGRIRLKIAGKDIDIRVSTIPIAHGERIVMRLLDKSNVLLDLTKIGFAPEMLSQFLELIHRSYGIIPVTGPTGSGKTTTLYSALSRINSPDKNILTCEDPIEYQLKGIGQMQVNDKIDLTFSRGLRAFLRQDPDVILVGETRDQETAEIAIQASLTGHLVFTTLHTNDSATAFTRLIDMGIQPFLVASSVIGILAQRLLRKVCTECRVAYNPTPEQLGEIGLTPAMIPPDAILYHASEEGCEACSLNGYSGRLGIYELMMVTDEIRSMVMRGEPAGRIKAHAVANGMRSLRDDGAAKIIQGITTIEEVARVTQEDIE